MSRLMDQFNAKEWLAERVDYLCTNNQIEYEALLLGLTHLQRIKVKDVDVFGDSMLVVQQVGGESQCLDSILRDYLNKCLDLIKTFDTFTIYNAYS